MPNERLTIVLQGPEAVLVHRTAVTDRILGNVTTDEAGLLKMVLLGQLCVSGQMMATADGDIPAVPDAVQIRENATDIALSLTGLNRILVASGLAPVGGVA